MVLDKNGKGTAGFNWFYDIDYQFLQIDYGESALIYGCESWLFGLFHYDYFWVISRKPSMRFKDVKSLREYIG